MIDFAGAERVIDKQRLAELSVRSNRPGLETTLFVPLLPGLAIFAADPPRRR